MKTAVVTDGKYRSSIAAVRALGRAGYRVVVTQTRLDVSGEPPVFASRYASETHWIEGSCKDGDYPARLMALLREYSHPVLLCAGAVTLNAVAAARGEFAQVCDFLIAPPEVLDALNDKEAVHRRGLELGIPVPAEFSGTPDRYPVIIKPRCGEKFGLKAQDRYKIAGNEEEYALAMELMTRYDPEPIVQEKIDGEGLGVSLLLDRNSRLISALCHRRIREYPVSGGPSTCCESFYDGEKIEMAYKLLQSFGFVGMAMVEFKGRCLLEVNPRVWGSFPMTEQAESSFTEKYARAAAGEPVDYTPGDYISGVKMRFLLNDTLAVLGYFRRGQWRRAFGGVLDAFRAREALGAKDDPAPFRRYLQNYLLRK